MGTFFIGDYITWYVVTSVRFWKGYTFKPATTITVTSLLRTVSGNNGGCHVAIYRASPTGHPYELLRSVTVPIGDGVSGDHPTWYMEYPVEPVTLSPDNWYLIAQGATSTTDRSWDLDDYFDVSTVIAGETIIDDWRPTASDRTELFWLWNVSGAPVNIVGRDPLSSSSGVLDQRPAVGFGYGGFNIWVKKSGEWIQVTAIWAHKGGAWQPVSSVDVNKDGWKPI